MSTPHVTMPATPASEPTHPCVRCGRPVALDVSLCETCNPLGLEQPATSQVHGTVFVAIVIAVIVLAVAGRAVLSGIGPFRAQVVEVLPTGSALSITLEVANDGTRNGATTCQLTDASSPGIGASVVVQSPQIAPGQAARFGTTTDRFGDQPVALSVVCQNP
jgi:hypothetical protein